MPRFDGGPDDTADLENKVRSELWLAIGEHLLGMGAIATLDGNTFVGDRAGRGYGRPT